MSIRISVGDLSKLTQRLLTHLESNGVSEVSIDEDYYWDVPASARYDPYSSPGEPTLGQLSDDWNELQAILDGRRSPSGYALVWLSSVLRRVGEKTVG